MGSGRSAFGSTGARRRLTSADSPIKDEVKRADYVAGIISVLGASADSRSL